MSVVKPGTFAAPVFPAAGIALACVLRFGWCAGLGVFLGSLAANLGAYWLDGQPVPGLAFMFAVGASLQALAGARLLKATIGKHPRLTRPKEIAIFCLAGCVAGSVVSATIANGAIAYFRPIGELASGAGTFRALALNWWIWYSGDTFGALVGAPITLTAIGLPRRIWHSRRATVAAPLVCATLLLGWATEQVNRWEEQRAAAAFDRDVTNAASSIEAHLQRHLDALTAVHGLFESDHPVSRQVFERATEPWLRSLPSLQALGFLEQIDRNGLPAREAAISAQDGRPFHPFMREPEIAAQDTFFLAVRFIEPISRNGKALGVNSLSISEPRKALLQTLQSGAPVATGPFRLTQESGVQIGVVVYQRVRGAPGQQQGVAFATLRMGDALANMTAKLPQSLEYCLLDQVRTADTLAGSPRCAAQSRGGPRVFSTSIAFAARQWELRIVPTADAAIYGAGLQSDGGTAWVFAASGMVACALLGALLLLLTGRAREVELTVRQRTRQVLELRSENELSESALRSTEQQFKLLFDKVPVGVVFVDKDGKILQPNAWYCNLLGYTEQELRSKNVLDITPPEDALEDQARRTALTQTRGSQYRYVKRYIRADGQELQVRVTATVMRDREEGQPDVIVSLVEDLSEQLRLEEAQQARAVAEAANKAKTEFLSRMSHELRTPLNAVLGFAQLMHLDRSLPYTEKHLGWLKQMQEAGWHLLQLIDDVLDLSRVEAGAVTLTNAPLHLPALLGSAIAMVESDAQKRGIRIDKHLSCDTPVTVLADVTRLRQVLINLLSNAIKYNRPGGSVSIHAHCGTPDRVTIDISDTGLGMSAAQLPRLFKPFDRLGRENSNVPGAGIGLYITKLLVERMNGEVHVRSQGGQGTTFSITLPTTDDSTQQPEAAADDDRQPHAYQARKVLLIEDNGNNVDVISAMVALRPQISLEVSRNGLSGLAASKLRQPDLVLLDLRLPDISGIAVLEGMRSDPATRDVPVIVLSASADQDQISEAMRLGAQAFLPKPIVTRQFLNLLDDVLSNVATDLGELN